MFSSGIEEEVNGDKKHTSIVRQSNVFDLFVHYVTTTRGRMAVRCCSRQCIWISHVRVKSYTHILLLLRIHIFCVPSRLPSRDDNNGAPHIMYI